MENNGFKFIIILTVGILLLIFFRQNKQNIEKMTSDKCPLPNYLSCKKCNINNILYNSCDCSNCIVHNFKNLPNHIIIINKFICSVLVQKF